MTDLIRIFIAYARKDKEYLEGLKTHLRTLERSQLVKKIWYDGEIMPGQKWEEEIEQNLESAEIILLLISADFIASDYCYSKELKRALERQEAQTATVIPVIIRACDWQDEAFATLQIPNEGKPFPVEVSKRDPFCVNVVEAVKRSFGLGKSIKLNTETESSLFPKWYLWKGGKTKKVELLKIFV